MKNKSKVLVTLVAENYLEYAKQMFASAYFNGGWGGDFMILAYNIPDEKLSWFYDRGFFVKHRKPLYQYDISKKGWSHFFLTKLYLFEEDMKQWEKVIYIDVDCIIRASLSEMEKVKTIAGVPFFHVNNSASSRQTRMQAKDLFMGGTFSFDTSLISPNTFNDLLKITDDLYRKTPQGMDEVGNEEVVYKKYFGDKIEKLSIMFNFIPLLVQDTFLIKKKNIKGVVLHLAADSRNYKPWHPSSAFHQEWLANLSKADKIDLAKVLKPIKAWSSFEIWRYEVWLHNFTWLRRIYLRVDRLIGQIGLRIKTMSPKIYLLLKKLFKR